MLAARRWSEASQELVGAAAGLILVSRTLAGELDGDGAAGAERAGGDRAVLGAELGMLANTIEGETAGLRDDYLETAARIDTYSGLYG